MLAAVYHFSYSIPITPFRANFPTTFSWCVCEIGATLSRKNTEQFTIKLWRKRVATTSRKSLLRKLAKRVIYINSWIVYSIVFRTLIHHFRLQPNTPQYAVWYNHRSRTLNILGQVWTMHTSIIHKLVPAFLYGTVSLSKYFISLSISHHITTVTKLNCLNLAPTFIFHIMKTQFHSHSH